MNQQLEIIIKQMLMFIILLGIGAIGAKVKVLTREVLDALAKVVVNITLPALIIGLVPGAKSREMLIKTLPLLIGSFLLIALLFILGRFSAKISRLGGSTSDVHTAETTFGNVGFMGIPLVQALFGGQGLLYMSIFSIADHTLLWTLGVYLTSGGKVKNEKNYLKKIINPTTIALFAALILLGLEITPKGVLGETISGLGNTSKYLSMIFIGGTLAAIDFKSIWKRKSIILLVLFKMLIAPILVFLLASLAGGLLDNTAVMTLTIIAALPSMVTIAILARTNGSDHIYATECVFITTILSLFTIPAVMWILSMLA